MIDGMKNIGQSQGILRTGHGIISGERKSIVPGDSFTPASAEAEPGVQDPRDIRIMMSRNKAAESKEEALLKTGDEPTASQATAGESIGEKMDLFSGPFRNLDAAPSISDTASEARFSSVISTVDGEVLNNEIALPTRSEKISAWIQEKVSDLGETMSHGINRAARLIMGEAPSYVKANELTKQVLALDDEMSKLSDKQLQAKTTEFKQRLKQGETLDDILPEAFAVCREAASRVTGMKHYPEQVLGGVCAHQGRIVEMKTGEGKTLMETLPAYLNALSGDGVHIVTVNEYLAERDKNEMGQVFESLGLSVGFVKRNMTKEERKAANQADITYGTNSEFGFQYLLDNLTHSTGDKSGRDLSKVFAMVDEVDSILIDEARTPLIISGTRDDDTPPYRLFAEVVHNLKPGLDFEVDEKKHQAWLTEKGLDNVENMLGVGEIYTEKNQHMVSYLHNALQARALYQKDKQYIVDQGKVKIVDEFTGRVLDGRRFSRGIHPAIEAKEGLEIKGENETLASISYQNFFKHYGKMAGMTGTGKTSEKEFAQVFGKGVDVIPTHKPIARKDIPDLIFPTAEAKMKAAVRKIAELNSKGRPVLIGTRSVESSEELSRMLVEAGVSHAILNAKYHSAEADIIAQAGRPGSVTIATNMAGRGVDIKLGGDPKGLARQYVKEHGGSYDEALGKFKEQCRRDKEQVLQSGGLFVLGTEKHKSRRVDDQLRGRSGRQGDPGSSQFYVSLEDETVKWFAGDEAAKLAKGLGYQDGPIHGKLVQKAVNMAQEKAEDTDLEARKNLLKYDEVMNLQRESIYENRDMIMESDNLRPQVEEMIIGTLEHMVDRVEMGPGGSGRNKDDMIMEIARKASYITSKDLTPQIMTAWKDGKIKTRQKRKEFLADLAMKAYDEKEKEIGPEIRNIEKNILLNILDGNWTEQMSDLNDLREGIGWRSLAQEDPKIAFSRDAYELYENMWNWVSAEMTRAMLSVRYRPTDRVPHPEENAG